MVILPPFKVLLFYHAKVSVYHAEQHTCSLCSLHEEKQKTFTKLSP